MHTARLDAIVARPELHTTALYSAAAASLCSRRAPSGEEETSHLGIEILCARDYAVRSKVLRKGVL
jgi:hypothetical protein